MFKKTSSVVSKTVSFLQAIIYLFTITLFPLTSFAQNASPLPVSTIYNPVIIQGMTIHPENPFQLDFIIDPGDTQYKEAQLKEESTKLIKYFLTSLTVPEKNMWVNLSPYEKDRIIGKDLQATEMGKDLLELDLQLKQLASSILNPENAVGQEFWNRVHQKVEDKFGNAQMPVNFHNKVWIVPEKAVINIQNNQVFIGESHLKVLHESDYLSIENSLGSVPAQDDTNSVSNQILKEVIIPELEKEVNNGRDFAKLRQIYHSSILAAWYKKNLKESLLSKIYNDQNKTEGIQAADQNYPQKVYNDYLQAFQLGAFDFIKDEYDPSTQQVLPKKYFSGGIDATNQQLEARVASPDTMMMGEKVSRALLVAVTLVALCAGGCGDNGGNNNDETPGENPTPTATVTPGPSFSISRTNKLANIEINPNAFRSFTINGVSYVAVPSATDIKFFDVNDPMNPVLVSTLVEANALRNAAGINEISTQGSKLLIRTNSSIFIYDLSNGVANARQIFDMDITNPDTVAPFLATFPDFDKEYGGNIEDGYKSSFQIVILPVGGFAVINNAPINKDTNIASPGGGGVTIHVDDLNFFAIFDSEGNFTGFQDNLTPRFPEIKVEMKTVTEKNNIVYSVSNFNIVTEVIGSMEASGRTDRISYPNGPIKRYEFTEGIFTFSEQTGVRPLGSKTTPIVDSSGSYMYTIEQGLHNGSHGSDESSILRIRLDGTDEEKGTTVQFFPASTAGDQSRGTILNFTSAEIENGMRIMTNQGGTIAITDFNNGEDRPRLRILLNFNKEGVSNPTSPSDQNNLVQTLAYDKATDLLLIHTQDGTTYSVNVTNLIDKFGDHRNSGSARSPILFTDLLNAADNMMAAFPSSDLATTKFTKGGIDLNSANLELTIKGETIHFSIPKELENINPAQVQGMTPTIINFSPWVPLQSGLKP
jgi:hypothetical protein